MRNDKISSYDTVCFQVITVFVVHIVRYGFVLFACRGATSRHGHGYDGSSEVVALGAKGG